MATGEIFIFINDRFGRPFAEAAVSACRPLEARLTLVMVDPVAGMGAVRRRRTRLTRPLREIVERRRRGTRVWLAEDVNDRRFLRRLPRSPNGIVTGYMQIFRPATIARFASLVNLHPALLPYYRGPAPLYWCQENGEARSGYTLHELTEAIDAGPVLRQEVVPLSGLPEVDAAAIVAAAVPAVVEWLRHLLTGAGFPRRTIDAATVYRVLEPYRSFGDYEANERRRSRLT